MTGTLQEICAEAGASGCVDLTADLVPTYLSAIPKDPQATGTSTLYQIAINPVSQIPELTASNSVEYNLTPIQIGTTSLAGGGGGGGEMLPLIYSVTFNSNGGSGSMASQEIEEGSSVILNSNTFTRSGYIFGTWNTMANGTGIPYANNTSYYMESNNVTLYAQWNEEPEIYPSLIWSDKSPTSLTWENSMGHCATMNTENYGLVNYEGWRLPNVGELAARVAVNKTDTLWSSDVARDNTTRAYYYDATHDSIYSGGKTHANPASPYPPRHARCVRFE